MRTPPVSAAAGPAGFAPFPPPFLRPEPGLSLGSGGSGSKGSGTGSPGGDRGGWRARKPPSLGLPHFPVPGRSGRHRRPPARPRRAHVSFSPPFFAVVIEDDRIDDVLKNMTDKAPPGV